MYPRCVPYNYFYSVPSARCAQLRVERKQAFVDRTLPYSPTRLEDRMSCREWSVSERSIALAEFAKFPAFLV